MNKRKGSLWRTLLACPHILWCILFIAAPLCFVLYYAFTDRNGHFTFANFGKVFTDPSYLGIFGASLKYAVITTAVCLLLAYPLAYAVSRMKIRHQSLLVMLLMLPMWMNFLVRTDALVHLMKLTGIVPVDVFGVGGALVLGMVYNYLPFMVLPIYTVLSKIDPRLIEASKDLGANPFQTLLRVVFPLTLSGIISGVTMVFVPCMSTFHIAYMMTNNRVTLVGDQIEEWFRNPATYNTGSVLALILMILILISMFIMNRFGNEEEGSVMI